MEGSFIGIPSIKINVLPLDAPRRKTVCALPGLLRAPLTMRPACSFKICITVLPAFFSSCSFEIIDIIFPVVLCFCSVLLAVTITGSKRTEVSESSCEKTTKGIDKAVKKPNIFLLIVMKFKVTQ